jgi:hypothetical protein
METHRHTGQPLRSFLDISSKGAGVDERKTPCLALGLGSRVMRQGDEGVVQVG